MAVTAAEMVEKIRAALLAHPVGVVSVTVDGQTVQYSRKEALDELKHWTREAATTAATRPRVASINLRGF